MMPVAVPRRDETVEWTRTVTPHLAVSEAATLRPLPVPPEVDAVLYIQHAVTPRLAVPETATLWAAPAPPPDGEDAVLYIQAELLEGSGPETLTAARAACLRCQGDRQNLELDAGTLGQALRRANMQDSMLIVAGHPTVTVELHRHMSLLHEVGWWNMTGKPVCHLCRHIARCYT